MKKERKWGQKIKRKIVDEIAIMLIIIFLRTRCNLQWIRLATSGWDAAYNLAEMNPNLDEMNPNLDEMNPNLYEMNPNLDEMNPNLDEMNPNLDEMNPNLDEMYPNVDDKKSILYEM